MEFLQRNLEQSINPAVKERHSIATTMIMPKKDPKKDDFGRNFFLIKKRCQFSESDYDAENNGEENDDDFEPV